MAIDYKQKFLDIKSKFLSSVDTAYRMGFEQGQKDALLQNLQQQQQQQMQMQAQMMGQQQDMTSSEEGDIPPEQQAEQFEQAQQQEQMDNQVSELEAGIQELSELLGKNEVDKVATKGLLDNLNKNLESILRVREAQELKKNMESIKKIGKAVNKVKGLSLSFKNNASKEQKAAVSMQKTIVNDIMAKWEAEEEKASKDILDALKK